MNIDLINLPGTIGIGKTDVVGFLHNLHLQPIMASFGEQTAANNALRVVDRASKAFTTLKKAPIVGQLVKAAEVRVPELALLDYGGELLSDLERAVGFDPSTPFERPDYIDNGTMRRWEVSTSQDQQGSGQSGHIDLPHYNVGTTLYDVANSNMPLKTL